MKPGDLVIVKKQSKWASPITGGAPWRPMMPLRDQSSESFLDGTICLVVAVTHHEGEAHEAYVLGGDVGRWLEVKTLEILIESVE